MDLPCFPFGSPFIGELGAEPVSDETEPHMIADPVRTVVKDRADLHIALELAEGIFDRQQVLVIAQHLLFGASSRFQIGVQQIKAVQILLTLDEFLVFLILELALLIDLVLEIFMGLELLELATNLTG